MHNKGIAIIKKWIDELDELHKLFYHRPVNLGNSKELNYKLWIINLKEKMRNMKKQGY